MVAQGKISDFIRYEGNNSYTWSPKAFKVWKKKFKVRYRDEYGISIDEVLPSSGDREALYKRVFQMEGVDIFGNGDTNSTVHRKINEGIFLNAKRVADLLNQV